MLRRSILTEKIARRGYHLSREYAIDPLEILFVREVMRTSIVALPADAPQDVLRAFAAWRLARGRQRLYPVVGEERELVGVVTRTDLQTLADAGPGDTGTARGDHQERRRRSPIPTNRCG